MMNLPNVIQEYVVNLSGKEYIQYPGLLLLAHEKGLVSIVSECLQEPTEQNGGMAVFRATVVGLDNRRFVDEGDASPKSVNRMIIPHVRRMASTRAKARALRDFTGCGMTALEEIDIEDTPNAPRKEKTAAKSAGANAKGKEESAPIPPTNGASTKDENQQPKNNGNGNGQAKPTENGNGHKSCMSPDLKKQIWLTGMKHFGVKDEQLRENIDLLACELMEKHLEGCNDSDGQKLLEAMAATANGGQK
jgi:hypothetical protein